MKKISWKSAKSVCPLCKVPSVTQRLGTQCRVLPDKLNLCPLLFHIKWLFPSPRSASTGPGLGVIYGTAGILEDVLVCVLVQTKLWEETFEGFWQAAPLNAGESSCSLFKGSLAPSFFTFTSGASGLFRLLILCCTAGSEHLQGQTDNKSSCSRAS